MVYKIIIDELILFFIHDIIQTKSQYIYIFLGYLQQLI